MKPFPQQIQEWQYFYSTVGTACATLLGLLFVSLSVNIDFLRRKENEELFRVARRTFSDFLYVLMIALVFLVPHQVPYSFGIAMIVLGGSRLLGLARLFGDLRRAGGDRVMRGSAAREIGLPLVAGLGLILTSIAILLGYYQALYWLVGVVAALVTSASGRAWFLLVYPRDRGNPQG